MLEVDVLIVGNGPSGLACAAALGGLVPRVRPLLKSTDAADDITATALKSLEGSFIDEVDLYKLGSGIKRRCYEPAAALFDALRYPGGDGIGESLLDYAQVRPPESVPRFSYAIVGAVAPGGSWQEMSPSTVALSPGEWMDLPGDYSLEQHLQSNFASEAAKELAAAHGGAETTVKCRLPRWLFGEYYTAYARHLSGGSLLSGKVISIERLDNQAFRFQARLEPLKWGDRFTETGVQEAPPTILARAVVLAGGTFDVPRRLELPNEDLPFICHRRMDPKLADQIGHLVVVGAGLSSADCIIATLLKRHGGKAGKPIRITHIFRGVPTTTKICTMFSTTASGPSAYHNEDFLAQLMRGEIKDARYRAVRNAELVEIGDGCCTARFLDSGRTEVIASVDVLALLLGADPNLGVLPECAKAALAEDPRGKRSRTDGQVNSHPCFLEVDPGSFRPVDRSTREVLTDGLFALGPLRGDNFVRFLQADAYVVRRELMQKELRPE